MVTVLTPPERGQRKKKKSFSVTVTTKKNKNKTKNGFLNAKPHFVFERSPKHNRIVAALQPLLLLHRPFYVFLHTMVFELFLTSQDGIDVFPAVVFRAVALGPVGGFERRTGAVQGADHPPTGLHCSFRVPINELLSRLCAAALLLKLALRLLLLIVTRPTGGAHKLFALLLSLPVVLLQLLLRLESHDETQRFPVVVYAAVRSRLRRPLTLFSPFPCPPHADDDAEEAEQAEEDAQKRHQVVCGVWERKYKKLASEHDLQLRTEKNLNLRKNFKSLRKKVNYEKQSILRRNV